MTTTTPTHDAIRHALDDVEAYSALTRRTLRTYQTQCARAITRSVLHSEGKIITVMFARQMGKNETSAQLEAYLLRLHAQRGGSMVKAAPSFKPQIINSILRLKQTLDDNPLTRRRWRPVFGYMIQLGSASISFLSADAKANVVGATASHLLELDEAQGVGEEKYDRDFRPMASSTNATTVLYGTAWSEDSILETQKRRNLELQAKTGEQLHFQFDWRVLAATNAHYKLFVESEIARLGPDHPSIRTQYNLECLADAGRLFSTEQRAKLRGNHPREQQPTPGATYVAGIDLAGEDEQAEDAAARALAPRRDSTVITIAKLGRTTEGVATAAIVEHIWWTGRDLARQYDDLLQLLDAWPLTKLCVDASGIGAAIAAFLTKRLGKDRVEEVIFSAPKKSQLAYDTLAMINTDRTQIYAGSNTELEQLWREVAACRYWLGANETMHWGVPPTEGHDDFVASLLLCCRAADQTFAPAESGLVRSPPPDDDTSRW